MATIDESQFSLISLEDELTCSICLSPFNCPVTIPCGHNFCQDCLLATWKDCYNCPQCRTVFATKPELKKNTVLSTVVETFNLRLTKSGASVIPEKTKAKKKDVIRCDSCMEAEASQTCHTCMASFCEEHLRPHRENPVFRLHQLTAPVSNLLERICTDHHKLMEFFCSDHAQSICSICLQQVHKGCSFSELRGKLGLLDGKIIRNETVVSQMRDMQNKLKDSAANRMKTLSAEYQQMRDMLAKDERDALMAVERELESGQSKLKGLMKKFTENIDSMSKAKEDIHSLLSQSQTVGFLQATFMLPQNTNFDPYAPRINLDSKKVIATQAFAAALKEHLTEMFKQPIEARQVMLKPEQSDPQKQKRNPRSHSPGRSNMQPLFRPWNPVHAQVAVTSDIPPDITSAEKRSELLKYATVLTMDQKTAHKRIALNEHENYPDTPERFTVCSQVLTSKGFSRGRHYWEVRLSSNNFIGLGLAYKSIDRKGPTSRLGRNAQSWCVEWFNVKLSAWHNSSETVLVNPNSKRVGVLLDCEGGTATFYNVADRAYPFHSFVFPFAEAVYPAFWIFSSGSSISLCKLQD
ncbi:E3 ubiquitin/ISG15 ligase TRIM25 [Nibea albiflora]|uniref:E3 ubiquitin/ISG15 ligase TRIM25 n=1 Tax=Nibea albiflora TaxID=240163 RepID=A0ACB7FPG3_NIBAL|nr:E3 ubiquitin/ISG15 ligase TRIM25 [Nibea albiflora]